ncbi:MAG: DUF6569 family protein [Gemmataceae bacterium]
MLTSYRSRVRVGDPINYRNLAVFPLYAEELQAADYRLSDEALADQQVLVREVGQEGSVPDLVVENRTNVPVLFLEGEELVGAKQNRVLNASVLVPALSELKVPVSCVEQGRWRYSKESFDSSQSMCSSQLRHKLKASVSASLKMRRGHRADQHAVWQEVARQQHALGAASQTLAMSDTFIFNKSQIDEYQDKLNYPEGAVGLAVALGARVLSFDLFDQPATCRKVWGRLLSGYVLDALEDNVSGAGASRAAVEIYLNGALDADWQASPSVGVGQELRTEIGSRHGSALCWQGRAIHISVVGPETPLSARTETEMHSPELPSKPQPSD